MATNFKISTAARNAAANAIAALCNSGTIQIRTGAPPANVADADAGTLLGTLTFGATAFGNAASGTATANAISSDTTADASGDAGHFRAKDGSANTIFQGTAGNAADSPDMTFDNKSIVAGGTIAISSLTLTVPIQ
jgi:hypothetical protein